MTRPIFGGSRRPRLSDRQLDTLLRRYDWYWKPAPPIRWPWSDLLSRWVRTDLVVRREP